MLSNPWYFLSREANRYYTLYDTYIFTDSSIMASGSAYILKIKIPASNNYYWNLRDGESLTFWCFRFLSKTVDVDLSYVLLTTALIILTHCTYIKGSHKILQVSSKVNVSNRKPKIVHTVTHFLSHLCNNECTLPVCTVFILKED